MAAGCGPSAGEGPGHRSQALALTPAQEVALGEQAYREVLRKSPAVPSGAATTKVREIGERIARASEIEPLRREINLRTQGYQFAWEFNLIKSDQINAFCLPGGKVAVFTGLLSVAETDDQLATVMSHEIAHALAHHASERIAPSKRRSRRSPRPPATFGGMDPGSRERMTGLLSAGAGLRGLAYDRQQESEADHIGVFLMTFAGYDPAQAVTFWERMVNRSGRHGPPEILSDHPSDAHRVNQIRQWNTQAVAGYRAWKEGRIAR